MDPSPAPADAFALHAGHIGALASEQHHRVTPDDVIAELTAAGLAAKLATESLPEQYIVLARR